jgi:hypothetical protein
VVVGRQRIGGGGVHGDPWKTQASKFGLDGLALF